MPELPIPPMQALPSRPPLDTSFNAATLHIAQHLNPCGWDVLPNAPETLAGQQAYLREHDRLGISGEHCENTIFGDPEINIAFRAWHDWCHVHFGLPFTLYGEKAVAEVQIGHLHGLGLWTPFREAMVRCEVVKQAEWYERTGSFPEDQWEFTMLNLDWKFTHNDLGQRLVDIRYAA